MLALLVLLFTVVGPAQAARVTVICAMLNSTDDLTKYVNANEFVFDSDTQSLDMRVKNSGANWFFVTQKTEFLDDVFSVKIGKDGTVSAAGLRNSVPVAFRLNPNGGLDFAYVTDKQVERIHYSCAG
jgi:hypothetical protein